MAADVAFHVRRWEKLRGQTETWRQHWQELAEFLFPRKADITRKRTPGSKTTDRLFDSTPIHAVELLAAQIHGSVTSPQSPWFRLKLRESSLNENQEAATWLDEVTKRMYLAIQQSNFSPETHEVYLDLAAFGTACMYIEEKEKVLRNDANTFGGLRFRAEGIGEYVVDEDADGQVDCVYVLLNMTVRAAGDRWGVANLGRLWQEKYEKTPEEMVEILRCVGPRTLYDPTKKDGKNKPWYVLHIGLPHRKLLSEGGYEEFPYVAPRWAKKSGEVYGRGPGMTALPDVRTLNRAVELSLEAAAMAVAPPVEVPDDGVIGNLDMSAYGVNIVDRSTVAPGQPVIRPLVEFSGNFQIATLTEEGLRQRIQQIFYWEQLQLPNNKDMTATEVQERTVRILRILAPMLSRLEPEYLTRIIDRVFGLMYRAGALPPVPESLSDANMDVEFEGPLARSQKMERIDAVRAWLAMFLPLAEANPGAFAKIASNVDWDKIARDTAGYTGFEAEWLLSEEQRDQIRAAEAQAAQQQEKLNSLEQGSQMIRNAAPGVKALTDLAGQAQANGAQTNGQMAGAA